MKSRAVGSTLLIAGTTLGAGMLALPILSAGEGFPYAVITLIGLWALMLYGALLIVEVNLIFPLGASFSTLAGNSLGRWGQLTINLCMGLLFYCLLAAYIAGGANFLSSGFTAYFHGHWPLWVYAVLFTAVLGGLVIWKTSAVDMANRLLITLKMIIFFTVIFWLLPHVNYTNLRIHHNSHQYILMTIPIFFTAFGFHGSIPSIVKYVGHHTKTLRRIFVFGSAFPLVLYLLWEIVTLGILPQQGNDSFASIARQHGSVTEFIRLLSTVVHSGYLSAGINFFTDIAMTTSFLGVALGLFDFYTDILQVQEQVSRRVLVVIITFVPPVLFAIIYPQGFLLALGYAAIPLALLAIVLPALMVFKIRAKMHEFYPYQVAGGFFGLIIMLLFGASVIVLQVLVALQCLPVFSVAAAGG